MHEHTVSFNAPSPSAASKSTGGFQYPVPRRVTVSTVARPASKARQFKIKMTVPTGKKGK